MECQFARGCAYILYSLVLVPVGYYVNIDLGEIFSFNLREKRTQHFLQNIVPIFTDVVNFNDTAIGSGLLKAPQACQSST
jgi:hypothetical protein